MSQKSVASKDTKTGQVSCMFKGQDSTTFTTLRVPVKIRFARNGNGHDPHFLQAQGELTDHLIDCIQRDIASKRVRHGILGEKRGIRKLLGDDNHRPGLLEDIARTKALWCILEPFNWGDAAQVSTEMTRHLLDHLRSYH
jgi:hypothetical protein